MPRAITAEKLRQLQDGEESFALVDTRATEDYEGWRVAGALHFRHTPDHEFDAGAFEEETGLTPEDEVITICAKGKSSSSLANALADAGYENVAFVQDGMEGWSRIYEVAVVPTHDPDVEIIQVQRRAKGCLGYVVGCASAGEAAVIDATRHTEEFVSVAADAGYEITHVLDTHVHADHISGGRALAEEIGASYHLGERATEREVAYEFDPLGRNEVVTVGSVPIKALFTPGHTGEMVSYLVADEAVCTGDTLFVDSVGRTELQFGEGEAREGAALLYDSLHATLLSQPDTVALLPGHFSVSNDGEYGVVSPGEPITVTIGDLRTGLGLLELDREEFVEAITARLPEKPPNYERVIEINTGRREVADSEEAIELELGPNRCAATGD
ncbi:MBL fold metallo-hydrolase [Natronorarus salvus]|uniref:MBL fold metallo-hydrolase n=1 Tax=Natronorarus salvus TaxID=3117733 RepID=UPI002F260D7F